MSGRDFDFILASIHYLEDFGAYWIDERRLQPKYPTQQLFESHYQTVLKAIEFGGFDGIAHIDFPRRYFPEKYEPDGLLSTVLKNLVNKGIALEINSEPIHHGDTEVHPSNMICEVYVKLGGRKVTIGSDAHRCSRIGQDFEMVLKTIQRYNLQVVCFIQRQEYQLGQT
jgi:histidinol-phosphatase (PHP family)